MLQSARDGSKMEDPASRINLIAATIRLGSLIAEKLSKLISRNPYPPRERSGQDRRKRDRRDPSLIPQRLRTGLWLQYHKATRAGEFDPLALEPYRKTKVHDSIAPEMHKYIFKDRYTHSALSAEQVLASALDYIWTDARFRGKSPRSVFVIEAIAEHLCKQYDVTSADKRAADCRSATA
jgi:hypothetical protein